MATLHLLHGFAGAGKTTFAKQLARDIRAVRFTPDEWMVKLYGNNPPEAHFADYFERITKLIWQVTEQMIQLEQDVILDFGFWSRASRDEARAKARIMNADVKLYFVTASNALMKHRVLERSRTLPEGALVMDEHAIDLLKHRVEPLADDEPHIIVSTDT
ncbi:MAG: ATP-binding protein [Deinococcota bacterium]